MLDLAQGDVDGLASSAAELGFFETGVALGADQVGQSGCALVEQGGMDPLHPPFALVGQGLVQTDLGADLEHMIGRDPRLG